jgi:hypothetical protein
MTFLKSAKIILLCAVLAMPVCFVCAQEAPADDAMPETGADLRGADLLDADSSDATPALPADASNGLAVDVPRTFREISLGMSLEDLKSALASDNEFVFRGDRDVSFLPLSEQNLVESAGFTFIKRAFFQLKDEKLFIMGYILNLDKIDHYSVFTTFVEKYGEPVILNPKQAMWESADTRIFIERPLTIKYIDRQVFDALLAESSASESATAQLRSEFLNDF